LALGVSADGPGIYLSDPGRKHRAVLARNNEGIGLDLLDDNGKPRVALHQAPDVVGLTVKDANGTTRGGLVFEKDAPVVTLNDDKEQRRAVLRQDAKTGASLGLYDAKGKLFFAPRGVGK
jgi:hypothetical protein